MEVYLLMTHLTYKKTFKRKGIGEMQDYYSQKQEYISCIF